MTTVKLARDRLLVVIEALQTIHPLFVREIRITQWHFNSDDGEDELLEVNDLFTVEVEPEKNAICVAVPDPVINCPPVSNMLQLEALSHELVFAPLYP